VQHAERGIERRHLVSDAAKRNCYAPCACTNIQNVGSRLQRATIRKFLRDVSRQYRSMAAIIHGCICREVNSLGHRYYNLVQPDAAGAGLAGHVDGVAEADIIGIQSHDQGMGG